MAFVPQTLFGFACFLARGIVARGEKDELPAPVALCLAF